MPDVTLSDYTGYILRELSKAREMADAYSREVALRYRQDEVLQHFATPRFKIPKMELTIPVLISGARYSQVLAFTMPRPDFDRLLLGQVNDVVRKVTLAAAPIASVVATPIALNLSSVLLRPNVLTAAPVTPVVTAASPVAKATRSRAAGKGRGARATVAPPVEATPIAPGRASSLNESVAAFHQALLDHDDLAHPESVIELHWRNLLARALDAAGQLANYKAQNPKDELGLQALATVTAAIKAAIVVKETTITNLLVSPETNSVKNGSNESSVFTIKAEVLEEGFFIKSIRDDDTGEERQIVEYE